MPNYCDRRRIGHTLCEGQLSRRSAVSAEDNSDQIAFYYVRATRAKIKRPERTRAFFSRLCGNYIIALSEPVSEPVSRLCGNNSSHQIVCSEHLTSISVKLPKAISNLIELAQFLAHPRRRSCQPATRSPAHAHQQRCFEAHPVCREGGTVRSRS